MTDLPDDPFLDDVASGDPMRDLLNAGALLYRNLRDADTIDGLIDGIRSLDPADLRKLALCATLAASQLEKGMDEFARWWESSPPTAPSDF